MRVRSSLIALLATALLPSTALADHPGSHVRVLTGNIVEVDVVFTAPDICHRIVRAEPGAPEDVTPPEDAIPATVTITRETAGNDGACQEGATPLETTFALSLEDNRRVVQIYFLDRNGETVNTERVDVPGQ